MRFPVAVALVLAGVPWRTCVWRYDRRRPPHWSRFFHQHIRQNRDAPGRHEVEHNLDVLRELGMTPEHDGLRVVLSEAEREAAAAILGAGGWDRSRPLVALHPGHGGGRQGWSAEAFGALADALSGDGFHVAVTGSPAEVELAQAVVANARASASASARRWR